MARVLIVDDDRSLRRVLRMGLERRGHQVEEAGDGEEALVAQQHAPAQVAIVDLAMPVMGGLELTVALRRQHPGMRILVVSGIMAGAPEFASVARRAGADDALAKPFGQADLASWVENRRPG